MLHSMAAHFPDEPTPEQSARASAFVRTFADMYPCRECAREFQRYVSEHPPACESRASFVVWMCEMHNDVSRRVGKPLVACDLAALDKAWRGA